MMPIARPLATVLVLAPVLALGAGCPKPDEKFDRFVDETEDEREDAANTKMDVGGSLEDINGNFLFALASFLNPPTPLQFYATVTFEPNADGSGGVANMELQPLSLDPGSVDTPREFVGDILHLENVEITAAGTFLVDVDQPTNLPGEANPITGSPITVATLMLMGSIQSADLFCGVVDGHVTSPIDSPLTGSTFAAARVTGPDALPTMVVGGCPMDGGGSESGGSESGGSSGSDGGSDTGG